MKSNLIRGAQYGGILLIAIIVYGAVSTSAPPPRVHALPEYAIRTGEPCATCHVSPGGGGPRTLRGMLWTARGRPDLVPALPDVLIAPGVDSGIELYDLACAACHGRRGEGLFGTSLADTALRESKIRATILRGRRRSGMPTFDGQFTDEQIEALVTYVVGLASGQIEPPPDSYPLPPGQLTCEANLIAAACGGN